MDYTIALSYILCVENNTLANPIGELRRKFIKRRMASMFPAFYFNRDYSPILTNQEIYQNSARKRNIRQTRITRIRNLI